MKGCKNLGSGHAFWCGKCAGTTHIDDRGHWLRDVFRSRHRGTALRVHCDDAACGFTWDTTPMPTPPPRPFVYMLNWLRRNRELERAA